MLALDQVDSDRIMAATSSAVTFWKWLSEGMAKWMYSLSRGI